MVSPITLSEPNASTIVQLLEQLERQGYAPEERRRVRDAYELAAPIYSCHYRSSGRSLIDHVVGTASIVGALGAPAPLVLAGLLHAIYIHGDFGTRLRRVTPRKRARVREVAGDAAEEIVNRYGNLPLTERTIPGIRERLPSFSPRDRDTVLVRLTDQLDIYGTGDALYCNNLRQRLAFARHFGPLIADMADELQVPSLAEALRRAYAECGLRSIPAALTTPAWRDGVTVPRSYRTRPSIAVYQRLRAQIWSMVKR